VSPVALHARLADESQAHPKAWPIGADVTVTAYRDTIAMSTLSTIASNLSIRTPAVTPTAAAPVATAESEATQTAAAPSATPANAPVGGAGGAGASQSSSSSSSSNSDTIEQLQKQIAELQKQLKEQQQEMARIQASQQSEESKAAAVAAIQAQVVATSAGLQTATAALLQVMQESGSSTAGSMVSTTA